MSYTTKQPSNPALNLAPFSRWTLRGPDRKKFGQGHLGRAEWGFSTASLCRRRKPLSTKARTHAQASATTAPRA